MNFSEFSTKTHNQMWYTAANSTPDMRPRKYLLLDTLFTFSSLLSTVSAPATTSKTYNQNMSHFRRVEI